MKTKGFTLIELLVAISIIAVLSTIGLIAYFGTIAKGRDNVRKEDLNKLSLALEISAQRNGSYLCPAEEGCPITTCPADGDTTSTFYTKIAPDMSDKTVPTDPKDHSLYCYISDGKTYTLCAKLENSTDRDINNPPSCKGYNYGVVPK